MSNISVGHIVIGRAGHDRAVDQNDILYINILKSCKIGNNNVIIQSCALYFKQYIFICPSKFRLFVPTKKTRGVVPMLFQCGPNVSDVGSTLKQHWYNVSCLLGSSTLPARGSTLDVRI